MASVLMLAWAEVEHDLVYKPTQGELSEDEYAILDELNGLVLAGEIALERLQRAGDVRVSRRGSQFSNHYDLSSYLLDATRPMLSGPVSDSALGRVDELFELLRRAGSATPEALEPYLELLHADTERRPISEQIADQILAENPALYRTFAEIRAGRKTTTEHHENIPSFEQDSNYMQALGHFLARWITFERFSNELASILQPDARKPKFPTTRWLAQLGVLDEEALSEIEFVRRLRNNLVHGVERPDAPYLTEAANRLEALFEEFARSPNEAVQTAIERARLE